MSTDRSMPARSALARAWAHSWTRTGVTCALLPLLSGCASSGPSGDTRPGVTIREIMADMIAPAADVLWSAIQTVETANGYVDKVPETDEEWAVLRRSAAGTVEAADLLRTDGRAVAPAGATASSPGYQLEPDSIATLMAADRELWIRYARQLRESGEAFLTAIDARDAAPLFDLGDGLNVACEDCHQAFWYPAE